MTVQDDLATVRQQLAHLGPWRGAVGDEALARLERRLEQADKLAETVRNHVRPDVWIAGHPHHGASLSPADTGTTTSEALAAALAEWDGEGA